MSDLLLLALALLGFGVLVMKRVRQARNAARSSEHACALSCPVTGRDVECALLYDARRDVWNGVRACTGLGKGPGQACNRSCIAVLNLGIPLRPFRPVRAPGDEA